MIKVIEDTTELREAYCLLKTTKQFNKTDNDTNSKFYTLNTMKGLKILVFTCMSGDGTFFLLRSIYWEILYIHRRILQDLVADV